MSAASEQQRTTSAERLVFFTDAVVAIAMTLLILPLLEAVSDAAASGVDTAEYVSEHSDKLIAFALSFFIIGLFWRAHERLYARVERQDAGLFRLNMLWMFTIVWLPVATALVYVATTKLTPSREETEASFRGAAGVAGVVEG